MRILIPVLNNKEFKSEVSLHFGHAPFFALFDSGKKKLEIFENEIDHSDPNLTPVDQLAEYNIDLVFVFDIGQKAISLFRKKGIKLKTGNFNTVEEVIENLDNLEEVKGGCRH